MLPHPPASTALENVLTEQGMRDCSGNGSVVACLILNKSTQVQAYSG